MSSTILANVPTALLEVDSIYTFQDGNNILCSHSSTTCRLLVYTNNRHLLASHRMADRSLSPFLEQPSIIDGNSRHVREMVDRLQYELLSIKTEKKLLQQSKDSTCSRYEELLAKKSEELAALQSNFDFIYNQRKELQLKLQNKKDVALSSAAELTKEVKVLRSEKKSLTEKLTKFERLYQSMSGKCDHLRSDLNRELAANDQYRERVKAVERENEKMAEMNNELLARMKSLSSQLENNSSQKKVDELQLKLVTLQKTNYQLQLKVDQLLQQKTSVELMKQKNASLSLKLEALETAQERVSQLELANLELQARFDEYFSVIASTVGGEDSSEEKTVLDFVSQFKKLQNRNLIIFDKFNEMQTKADIVENENRELQAKNDEYLLQVASLNSQIDEKVRQVTELQKVRTLNGKEIGFLRKSLKDMDKVTSYQQSVRNNVGGTSATDIAKQESEKDATSQYLTNLEKLVDEYKHEIEELRKQGTTPHTSVPAKRPRLLEESTSKSNAASVLRNENLELLEKSKALNDELSITQEKLRVLEASVARANNGGRILQHRSNPFAKDQLVKKETLDLLKKENEDLIAKYITSSDVEVVPKSIFARQEHDKELLQERLDHLSKKINRLKNVYADKSKEIIAIISRYFGYSIEFIPSPMNPNDLCSKIKLVSKYLAQISEKTNTPYLILDLHSKSLKANGDYEFKSTCEDLVNQWVSERNQIPCFLSALNLRIYEAYAEKVASVHT